MPNVRRKKQLHLKPETVARLLRQVVERAHTVNRGPYVRRVKRLTLFGSVAQGKERPGDVDVCVEWDHYSTEEAERRHNKRLVHAPISLSEVQAMFWVEREPYRVLKGRSRGLSLHEWSRDRRAVETSQHRVIFAAQS